MNFLKIQQSNNLLKGFKQNKLFSKNKSKQIKKHYRNDVRQLFIGKDRLISVKPP